MKYGLVCDGTLLKMGAHCKNGPFFLILRKFDLNYHSSRLCLWMGIFYILYKNAKSIVDHGSQWKMGQYAKDQCSKWGTFFILRQNLHIWMRKRDRGKNPLKKVLNHVKYGGPTVKIAFFMRGATLFSLAIPPFNNSKLSNFANNTKKTSKKRDVSSNHTKNSSDDT